MKIQENVSLKQYSSFRIGGEAKYFCIAENEYDIKYALDFAIENKLKIFILGNGTNLLISDKGFNGLVIKIQTGKMEIDESGEGFNVHSESGVPLGKLVLETVKRGASGLEWAAGIPALLGGAVCSNAGAYGKSISESIESVKVLELSFSGVGKYLEKYETKQMDAVSCNFAYRQSIFKENKRFLILEASLFLGKGDTDKMQTEIRERIQSRAKKQPLEYPNVGSIFKNPILSDEEIAKITFRCSEAQQAIFDRKIPAGFLIEKIGLKGKKIGGAMISEKHANFIVNTGGATAEDVVILISLIKQKVRQKFDIQLHEEIEYVGF